MNSATSRRRFLASSAAAGSLLLTTPRAQASVRSANDRVRIAVAAATKYGVVVQHGTQRRSDANIAGLHEALKSGTLPRLALAYGYCCKPREAIGFMPDADPPATLDWNLWKGPAVIDDYHANLVHYNWHWFWKTGNGDLNNQGTHQLDVACWAIDDDQAHPVRALALGGRFAWRDQGETPNTMFAMAEYANGQKVLFNVRNVNYDGYTRQVENEYYLEDGSVVVGDGPFRIRRPGGKEFEPLDIPPGRVSPGGNWQSFVTAVRGRGSETRQRRRARCPPGLRARPPDEQLLPAGRRNAV